MDGTIEFIQHLDEFVVMIGLSVDGVASLGVIYQPTTEKLYYGTLGSGAFLIENRATRLLRVSPESTPLAMTIALSRSHHMLFKRYREDTCDRPWRSRRIVETHGGVIAGRRFSKGAEIVITLPCRA